MNATLRSTEGRSLRLSDLRGRAVVVFHEARDERDDNEGLKRACGRLVESGIHGDRLVVLGIADLRGLGALRPFVEAAVRRAARRYGVELWMDFEGVVDANVVILGPSGEPLFRANGPLSRAEVDALYAALGVALAHAAAHAA
jgi:hypothetical protein